MEKKSTEEGIEINIGPVHPSTHGVLKFVVNIEGDNVKKAVPEIGFVHRGVEKIAEGRPYLRFLPVIDKLDYVAALNWEVMYAMLLEKAANMSVTPRAVYIRTIMCELQRIMSHLLFIGHTGEDLGNTTLFMWGFRERELLMDVTEKISGGRLAPVYMITGGTFYDLPADISDYLLPRLDLIEKRLKNEYKAMSYENEMFKARTVGVGMLDYNMAKEYGITGPNLRATGVKNDLRKDEPYLAYDKLDFDAISENGCDTYSRFMVRVNEIFESIKIIKQALKDIPPGASRTKTAWFFNVPASYTFIRQETPRGEGAMYLVSDGTQNPYRLKIRSPCLYSVQAFERIFNGGRVADIAAIIGSLDPTPGEVDR